MATLKLVEAGDMPQQVRKRKGTLQMFSAEKIRQAVLGAARDAHPDGGVEDNFDRWVENVVHNTVVALSGQEVVSVDQVQDTVESVLMESGRTEVAKKYILWRDAHDRARAKRSAPMGSEAIADYISLSKYAGYIPEMFRREVYSETVHRTRDMHIRRYPHLESEIRDVFADVVAKRTLPSMRAMQFGGKAIEAVEERLYNCSYSPIDRLEFFGQALFLLLCGCGVGFSVQKHHVAKLPPLGVINHDDVRHHVIEDHIQGWGDALHALMVSAVEGYYLEFAYHKIRNKGELLKTSGGRAPGHFPLKEALEKIRGILYGAQGRRLKPIEAHDITCIASDAVLAGGIRRSALISLFSVDDEEMMNAKTGEWWREDATPWRARANNSAMLVREEVTFDQYARLFKATREWGEPGFFFCENRDFGTNPCVTEDTWVTTAKGAKQVKDLVGIPFEAWVDGALHSSDPRGFYKTGEKEVFNVQTREGFSFRATANHKVLVAPKVTRKKRYEEWREVGDLRPGDKVILHAHAGASWGGEGTEEEGWLLGMLLGDGNIEKSRDTANLDFWGDTRHDMREQAVRMLHASVEGRSDMLGMEVEKYDRCRISSVGLFRLAESFDITRECKEVSDKVEQGSSDFTCGFLRGWFDADGSVQGGQEKGVSVRLSSTSLEGLKVAQRMLARLGIVSTIYKERLQEGKRRLPDGRGGYAMYYCKATHELVIAGSNLSVFAERIGFSEPDRKARLEEAFSNYKRKLNQERFVARVESVTPAGAEPVFDCTVPGPHAFDGNGFFLHNCGEIGLNPNLVVTSENVEYLRENGVEADIGDTLTGFSFCNLSEVNVAKCKSKEDLYASARSAAFIGTLQAGYTRFPYLGPVSELIARREALIGVSLTGMMDSPDVGFDPDVLKNAAKVVTQTNREVAEKIGINPAARTTCVKPSGTASIALGCVGSGIHPHHSRRYFRRIKANPLEPVYQHFKAANPHMCESVSPTEDIITFCVEAPEGAIVVDDLTAMQFLEMVLVTQKNWVIPGTADDSHSPGLTHNVSNTIVVRNGEWDQVRDFLWQHRDSFSGVSMLPYSSDKAYLNAPREAVVTEQDEAKWNHLSEHYTPVDYTTMYEASDTTDRQGEIACAGGACEVQF